ncbi:MAG: starch-binding protein [Ruminococcus sp.]|nr:starch-binding protein [Ruminococcus sp.]
MNKTRKIISLVLVLMLVFSCTTVIPAAAAQTDSAAGVPDPGCALKFRNTLAWENVYLYAWNEVGDVSAQWPGEQLSPESTDDYGYEAYSLNIPEGATGIILNDGGSEQTADITDFYPEGGGYYLDPDRTADNGFTNVFVPIPLEETTYIVGDADGNRTINISDVTAIQKYLAGASVPEAFSIEASDVNQDFTVTIDDATLVQFYLAGIERKNNHCGEVKEISDGGYMNVMEFSDVLNWGKVWLFAYDKNGRQLTKAHVEPGYYGSNYRLYIPTGTASLTVVSEDYSKSTAPCTDSWILDNSFGNHYISWDKANEQYVLNFRMWGGLLPEFNFINSLNWDQVFMEEWDEYGNMVDFSELERTNGKYVGSPHFYTKKVVLTDGKGNKTDYITQFYCIPDQADTYCPDGGKTTVNDKGETVYVLKKVDIIGSFEFENSLCWDEVYMYAWNSDGSVSPEWPGQKLTDSSINDYGQEIYTVNVPDSAEGVILTDGNGSQTSEITDFSPFYYYLDGSTTVNEIGATVYEAIPFS